MLLRSISIHYPHQQQLHYSYADTSDHYLKKLLKRVALFKLAVVETAPGSIRIVVGVYNKSIGLSPSASNPRL